MRCPVCGKENKSINHYCESCGAKLGEKSKGPDSRRIITVLIISAIAIMILLEGIYVSSLLRPTGAADAGSSATDSADAGKSEDVEEKPEQGPDGNVEYSSTRYGIAAADDVIIRDQPSREATIIGALSKGEKVLLLDEKYSEDGYKWYHIQLINGNTGYVRGDLITVEGETDSLTEEAGNEPEQGADGLSDSSAWKYGIVATARVTIRNDASSEAEAIGVLDKGSRVRILKVVYSADGNMWYHIQLENGNTGYVRAYLITVEGETDSLTEEAGYEGKEEGYAGEGETDSLTEEAGYEGKEEGYAGEGETDSLTDEAGYKPEQGADGLSDSSAGYGIVATDHVIIRNDASSEAAPIGAVDEGAEVWILEVVYSDDGYKWYYIELENGNTGYVRGDLITVKD